LDKQPTWHKKDQSLPEYLTVCRSMMGCHSFFLGMFQGISPADWVMMMMSVGQSMAAQEIGH